MPFSSILSLTLTLALTDILILQRGSARHCKVTAFREGHNFASSSASLSLFLPQQICWVSLPEDVDIRCFRRQPRHPFPPPLILLYVQVAALLVERGAELAWVREK